MTASRDHDALLLIISGAGAWAGTAVCIRPQLSGVVTFAPLASPQRCYVAPLTNSRRGRVSLLTRRSVRLAQAKDVEGGTFTGQDQGPVRSDARRVTAVDG